VRKGQNELGIPQQEHGLIQDESGLKVEVITKSEPQGLACKLVSNFPMMNAASSCKRTC